MSAVEDRLAEIETRNTPSEIARGTTSRDIITFRPGEVGFVMAGAWSRASADALVLATALRAVLGIHYDEDGYCPGCGLDAYEEECEYGYCSTVRAITAALGVTP